MKSADAPQMGDTRSGCPNLRARPRPYAREDSLGQADGAANLKFRNPIGSKFASIRRNLNGDGKIPINTTGGRKRAPVGSGQGGWLEGPFPHPPRAWRKDVRDGASKSPSRRAIRFRRCISHSYPNGSFSLGPHSAGVRKTGSYFPYDISADRATSGH